MSSSDFGGVFVDDDYNDGLYASERSCLVQVNLKVMVQQRVGVAKAKPSK